MRRRFISSLCVLAAALGGCQTRVTTSDGRPMPPTPRATPSVPAQATVNAMAMTVGLKPADSNGNGYPDLIPVEIYLFAQPHPSAVHRPGTFEFVLYVPGQSFDDSTPLARWEIDDARQLAGRFGSPVFGAGYAFELSLLEAGGDQLPHISATLVCIFRPSDGGPPIRSTGDDTVRVGRR